MRADCSVITCRSWCCTAAEDSSPNRRASSLATVPRSRARTPRRPCAPKNSATTRALSVNAVSTSRETFSNSLRTNSASSPACSRSSTRAPTSIASATTRTGSSPASSRARTQAAAAGSSTTRLSTMHAPHEHVDAGLAEWRGGFHRRTRYGTSDVSGRREARQALGLLGGDLEARHRRRGPGRRARTPPSRRRPPSGALEHGLDRAVGRLRAQPATPRRSRLAAGRVAEEDALHAAVGDAPCGVPKPCGYRRAHDRARG